MPGAIAAVSAWAAALTTMEVIALAISIASVGFSLYTAASMSAGSVSQAERKQVLRASASYVTWLYGENESAGLLVFAEEEQGEQDDGETLHLVVTHCGHPIEEIVSFRLGDDDISTFGEFAVVQHYPEGRTTVDPFLMQHCPSWKDDMIGLGIAWYRITLKFNQEKFPSGLPNMVAVKRGRNNILDPRNNLTGYNNNNALCMLDFLKRHPSLLYQDDELILQSFIDGANICDEIVPVYNADGTDSGKVEKRYIMSAQFDLSEDPQSIFEKMLASCAGEIIRVGGRLGIQVGAYYGPALETVNDADVIGDLSIQPEVSSEEAYNIVRGVYVSAANNYQDTDYPEIRFDEWIKEDGFEKISNINLAFCTSPSQAMRIANILAYRARFGMTMDIPMNLRGIEFTPGSSFDLDRRQVGLSDLEFKVLNWEFSLQECQVSLTCRRESPDFYRDEVGRDIVLPPLINIPTGGIPSPTNAHFSVKAIGDVVQGVITWTNVSFQLRGTNIVVTRNSDKNIIQTAFVPFPGTDMPLNGALMGSYTVSITNIGVNGVESLPIIMTILIEAPSVPDAIDTVISNWNAQLTPVYKAGKTPFGTLFEFYITNKANYEAGVFPSKTTKPDQVASSWNHGGLTPKTAYYYFVRAINSYGVSNWTKVTLTTLNESDLVTTVLERLVAIEIYASFIASDQSAHPDFYIDGDGRKGKIGTIFGAIFIGSEMVSVDYVVGMVGYRIWSKGAEFNSGVRMKAANIYGLLTAASITAKQISGDIYSRTTLRTIVLSELSDVRGHNILLATYHVSLDEAGLSKTFEIQSVSACVLGSISHFNAEVYWVAPNGHTVSTIPLYGTSIGANIGSIFNIPAGIKGRYNCYVRISNSKSPVQLKAARGFAYSLATYIANRYITP